MRSFLPSGEIGPESGEEVQRRTQRAGVVALTSANLVGVVIVIVLLTLLLPNPPGVDDPLRDLWVLWAVTLVYLPAVFYIGPRWGLRMGEAGSQWLVEERRPDERELALTLSFPRRQILVHATLWGLAALLFGVLTALYTTTGDGVAVGVANALGGLATSALTYLLSERLQREITARALAWGPPARPTAGVQGRLLLSWFVGGQIFLLGIGLVAVDALSDSEWTRDRVALTALFLATVGLVVGYLATMLAARSVADPVDSVRSALARVERGDLDVEVPVYDASEVGLLQAGFNRMVAGMRERERLRDLFGRQVGEDVARAALERGVELGGEVREVAVLFVDLVGSTRLAAERPAPEVVATLNSFFEVVVAVAVAHGGLVNKFEGDAALCVFGAPVAQEDSAGAALAAAREMRDRLHGKLPDHPAGIGVSAGPAVAGNIGSAERFEYTVIGDPVNEAARLTELAKKRPGRLLASQSAVERAWPAERNRWQLAEALTLRGRSQPTWLAVPVDEAAAQAQPQALP